MVQLRAAISTVDEHRQGPISVTRRLLPAFATVPITTLLTVVTCVSYSSIVFSGPLAGFYGIGVGLAFVSAIVLMLTVSLTSSYPGSLAYAQAEPAVIVAVIAQGMATSLIADGTPEQVLPTVLVTISISSILCGLCFALLGCLRYGDLVRFVPLPVGGGFLGGIGYLLVVASLNVTLGPALSAELPMSLLRGESLARWVPAVGFGLALWILQNRRSHVLNLPVVLGVLVAVFWLAVAISGLGLDQLRMSGWLFASLPEGNLWAPGQLVAGLGLVAWPLFPSHALEFVTLVMVGTISVLLITSSIELSVNRDIDINRELRWVGIGNLMVGLLGTLPGYHSTSGSILTHRLGTPWRIVGLCTAALCLVILLIGPGLLSVMPKMVAAAVVFYVGLGFMVDWLCKTWVRMHPSDYLVLVLVFLCVAFGGLIQGLGVGIAAGLVIFVLRYSRVDAVRNVASGARLHSNVERVGATSDALKLTGDAIFVLTLQGYVFFGTSHKLLSLIRRRMLDAKEPPLRFLVLDFHLVSGLDSSAAASFTKLARYAAELGFTVVLASVPAHVLAMFRREGLLAPGNPVRMFADLDHALEWSEDRLLEQAQLVASDASVPIQDMLAAMFPDSADRTMFQRHLVPYDFAAGNALILQGADSSDLLFLESGRVEVRLEMAGRPVLRLRAMEPGTVVGEIAFYLEVPRSASVVAIRPGRAYGLTREALEQIEREQPRVATLFHQHMARRIAGKLADSNTALGSLIR
jgi:sulfate permease, SulP family